MKTRPTWWTNALLGLTQILVWGGSFFLLAVLANPVSEDTHWSPIWVYGSLSISLGIAGLLAPWVGRQVAKHKGLPLLYSSGFVMGLGLLIIALAPWLWVFMVGWCIIGISMALGLYDSLFAVVGQRYGMRAKGAITQVILISGLATTVTWPLLVWLVASYGWRVTCLSYALLLVVSIWPLYRVALPPLSSGPMPPPSAPFPAQPSLSINHHLLGLTAINFTIAAVIMTALSIQLLDLLQASGLSLPTAVRIGTLIGPCQVGVRALDLVMPKKHPIWTTFLSVSLTFLGLVMLGLAPALAGGGVILYSLGNGLRAILRGTLPLELFGLPAYAIVLGRLARPALLAQAITPLLSGYLLQQYGASRLLGILAGLAFLNIGTTAAINYQLRQTKLPKPVHHPIPGLR